MDRLFGADARAQGPAETFGAADLPLETEGLDSRQAENALMTQWTLFAATADLPGGSYAGPEGAFELRGHPTLVGRSRAASDPGLAARLWTASAELTGVDFPASLPVG